MNFVHDHVRRLAAAILLVGGVGLTGALTLPARSATPHHGSTSKGYTVSYYHQGTLLAARTIPNGGSLDVVWKDAVCSNGYGSPPAAFTWSGIANGVTSAPLIGPCGTAPGAMRSTGPDDLRCTFDTTPPFVHCEWTWKSTTGSATTSAKIGNPKGGTIANVYLYKRTALYAYLTTPGKAPQKVSVPAGADTVKFTPAP